MKPGRLVEALLLPFSTADCEQGPIVEYRPGRLTLRYDVEGEHGVVWTLLSFSMVLAITADILVHNCSSWAEQSGILRDATAGKGNVRMPCVSSGRRPTSQISVSIKLTSSNVSSGRSPNDGSLLAI